MFPRYLRELNAKFLSVIVPAVGFLRQEPSSSRPSSFLLYYLLKWCPIFFALTVLSSSVCEKLGEPAVVDSSDLNQSLLIAHAISRGINPYQMTIPELSLSVRGTANLLFNPHVTPHLPLTGVILLPLVPLDPAIAHCIWAVFSMLCAIVAPWFILKTFCAKYATAFNSVWLGSLLICSASGREDLHWGQWNFLLLLTVSLVFFNHRRNLDFRAGALLGIACSLKLALWPIALIYIVRRQLIALSGFFFACILFVLGPFFLIGRDALVVYLTSVPLRVPNFWGTWFDNRSLFALVARMFCPSAMSIDPYDITPTADQLAVQIPAWVMGLGAGLLFVATLSLLVAATRGRSRIAVYAQAIPFALVACPVAWQHYFLLLAIPLAAIIFDSDARPNPFRIASIIMLASLLFVDLEYFFRAAARAYFPLGGHLVPGWLLILAAIPTLLCLLLTFYILPRAGFARGKALEFEPEASRELATQREMVGHSPLT